MTCQLKSERVRDSKTLVLQWAIHNGSWEGSYDGSLRKTCHKDRGHDTLPCFQV